MKIKIHTCTNIIKRIVVRKGILDNFKFIEVFIRERSSPACYLISNQHHGDVLAIKKFLIRYTHNEIPTGLRVYKGNKKGTLWKCLQYLPESSK